ncbi:MAG: MBL fold metallo-hydrolase [Syntrophales bacterium]
MKSPVEKIATGIYRITLPMPFRLEHVHIYAFIHGGRVSIIDTGPNFPGTFAALKEILGEIGCSVEGIEHVLITHFHADHCGLAGGIKSSSGAGILIPDIEYRSANAFLENEGRLEKVRSFCLENGMSGETVEVLMNAFRFLRTATIPFTADKFLANGQPLRIGDWSFDVISTPGHTRGHVCFFCRENRILFSGDHVLPHITPNLSPDLLAPDFRPLKSFLDSLERLRHVPVDIVCPAHGGFFTDLGARLDETIRHHRERKELILEALKIHPKTACEISQDIFGSGLDAFNQLLALNEVYVHLVELVYESNADRDTEGNRYIFSLK